MIAAPGLDAAVSRYVGIVPRVERILAATADAPVPTCVCTLASDARVIGTGLEHVGVTGGGGRAPAAAAAAAVGEAVERYSATYLPADRIVRATAAELGDEAVAPERFALFAEAQYREPGFPFVPFDRQTRVPWVLGCDLRDGRPAWLPAELVFLGDQGSSSRIGYATSNGAACAPDAATATARGLYELVERDAFMLVWRNRLSLPLLEWRGHRKLQELEARYFAPTGLAYAAVDLSRVHGVPSVLGVVRARRGPGALGVGAGTAATVTAAWWKALSEAFSTHAAARRIAVLEPGIPAPDAVNAFHDHIRYHASAEGARAAAFLDASRDRVDIRDVPPLPRDGEIVALRDRIERAGSSAYAVDVTAPDVRRLGLHVVKTVAPELCALDVSHRARFLGGRRILCAAAELGLLPRPLRLEELNPDPHPFP
ncbi:MAG TPA: YcaO-like family protein [Gaiellaceae bacterium]|nr:YcaO-like family protein [Gaiellaceae bacterium]